MRWERLFGDLAAQLEHGLGGDERHRLADEERHRSARLHLRDRLLAHAEDAGGAVTLRLSAGEQVLVRPATFGRDWLAGDLVTAVGSGQCVVPLAALDSVDFAAEGPPRASGPAARADGIAERIGLGILLGELSRRRVGLTVITGREWMHGTLERVGADHADLALHEPGAPPRRDALRGRRTIPFAAIQLVRVA